MNKRPQVLGRQVLGRQVLGGQVSGAQVSGRNVPGGQVPRGKVPAKTLAHDAGAAIAAGRFSRRFRGITWRGKSPMSAGWKARSSIRNWKKNWNRCAASVTKTAKGREASGQAGRPRGPGLMSPDGWAAVEEAIMIATTQIAI